MLLSVDKLWLDNGWVHDSMAGGTACSWDHLGRAGQTGKRVPLELNATLGRSTLLTARQKDKVRHPNLRLCRATSNGRREEHTTSFTLLLSGCVDVEAEVNGIILVADIFFAHH